MGGYTRAMEPLVFSRDAIRELDRRAIADYAIPGVILMENAGRGVADIAKPMLKGDAQLVIVCGTGNNGGDGLVAARHLANAGLDLRVLIAGDPERMTGDARTNLEIVRCMHLAIETVQNDAQARQVAGQLEASSLVVDALFGTGLDRPIEGFRGTLIEAINAAQRAGTPVLGVDLPSGLDADMGEPLGVCVRAQATATFVGHKRGFENPASKEHTGRILVVDIGVPQALARRLSDPGG